TKSPVASRVFLWYKLWIYLTSFLLIICILFKRTLSNLLILLSALLCFLDSCTVVKNAPKDKPFIYDNKINIAGNLDKDEKKRLGTDLVNYWDDSAYARKVQQ